MRRFSPQVQVAIVVLFSAALAMPAQSAPAKNELSAKSPIKIGFITSLSGVGHENGKEMVEGASLYLDQIGHTIANRPVALVVENDESNTATAISKLRKLVTQDKVQVLDGILSSHIAYALVPNLDKYRIPMILPISSADDLTQRKRSHWVIRTGWTASQGSHVLGDWVYKTLGYKRVVTFGLDFPFPHEAVGGFHKAFEENGGKVIQKIWAPLGFVDFSSYIKRIRKDADAVFIVTPQAPSHIVPKQYKDFGPDLPIITNSSTFDRIKPDELAEGNTIYNSHFYSAELDSKANAKFVSAYREKYKKDPTPMVEAAYTSIMWIDRAARKVKGNVENSEEFLVALKSLELQDAPRGPIKLDKFANPIQNIYVCKVENVKGKIEKTIVQTVPKVSQFGRYNAQDFLNQPPYSKSYPPCSHCAD